MREVKVKIILGGIFDGKKQDDEHIIVHANTGQFWEALLILSEEIENFASSSEAKPRSAVKDIRNGLESQGFRWQDEGSGGADIGVCMRKNKKEQCILFSGDGCKSWYVVPLRKEIKDSLGGTDVKYLPLLITLAEEALYSMARRAKTFNVTHIEAVSKK